MSALAPDVVLAAAGEVTAWSGVPCSLLAPLQDEAARGRRYVGATVEGEALALAAGTWLGGGHGAVLLQNSGLGNVVNPLASLLLPCWIPALLVVSWRGEPGRADAVHHGPMGAATLPLLQGFGVETHVLRGAGDLAELREALPRAARERRVAAAVVPRGVLARGSGVHPGAALARRAAGERRLFEGGAPVVRSVVVEAFLEACGGWAAVGATGFIARELSAASEAPQHFPMQGSMGFAAALALGVARARPERPVAVLDGDGAVLMRLGTLATVGALSPARFLHLVLDDGAYASTGGQRSASPGVDLVAVALACGYARAAEAHGAAGVRDALAWAREACGAGPTFVRILLGPRGGEARERPEEAPPEIAARFRAWALGS